MCSELRLCDSDDSATTKGYVAPDLWLARALINESRVANRWGTSLSPLPRVAKVWPKFVQLWEGLKKNLLQSRGCTGTYLAFRPNIEEECDEYSILDACQVCDGKMLRVHAHGKTLPFEKNCQMSGV